ncbi:MAG: hypothetical protein KDA60_03175 [Planctomycetales bacterium]|nr:hypothetical protein [Planctomycetales bacterium]
MLKNITSLVFLMMCVVSVHALTASGEESTAETVASPAVPFDAAETIVVGTVSEGSICQCGPGRYCRHCGHVFPPGTMSQHFPYDATRRYYYDRPYNAGQVEQHLMMLGESELPRWLPYSNRVFTEAAERAEERYAAELQQRTYFINSEQTDPSSYLKDRPLEFVDWQRHRVARLKWEREKQRDNERKSSTRRESLPEPDRSASRGKQESK